MSSRTQNTVGMFALVLSVVLTALLAPGAAPAAAQGGDGPLTVILVVDEWDGEVMTAREGEGEGGEGGDGEGDEGEGDEGEGGGGDGAVDEWDGEVMTGGAVTGGQPVMLLVVARSAGPLLRDGEAGDPDEGDGAVDEWDGEVMTGGATVGGAAGGLGSCRLRVGGAAQSFRVLRAVGLGGGKVLTLPRPVRRAARP